MTEEHYQHYQNHPDFNRTGDWIGSATEITIRANMKANSRSDLRKRVTLLKHLRANGTKISEAEQRRPVTPPLDDSVRRDRDD